MNHGTHDDARYERLFADALVELAPAHAPDRLKTEITEATSESRPRPRWLAVVKEPPMRLASSLAVGSPTARMAAIMAATILIAGAILGAGIAGSRLFAAGDAIVVDASGGGDYTTIAEAVAATVDGDTVLVRPGTYTEAFIIEADITVKGDGPREEIVITAPADGPISSVRRGGFTSDPYAVLLRDTSASLSGLTFRGGPSQLHVNGGSPTISDVRIEGVGIVYTGGAGEGGNSMVINGGSTAEVSANSITGSGPIGVFDASEPLISENHLADGPHIWGGYGDGAVIHKNIIENPRVRGIGVFDPASLRIEGNTISDSGQFGIDIQYGAPSVAANVISRSAISGISVVGAATPQLANNELIENRTALSWSGSDGVIEGTNVARGDAGIVIGNGSPLVSENTVEGVSGRGIVIATLTGIPTLTGNRSCGNGENLFVAPNVDIEIDDSNEFCEDAPAE